MVIESSEATPDISNIEIFPQHLLFIEHWRKIQLDQLFELADHIENHPTAYSDLMKGKILYNLFFQPSTRTKNSFECAMKKLGGQVINECSPQLCSAMTRGESLSDMLRVLSEYSDIIILRHPCEQDAIPAINALNPQRCKVISGGLGHVSHPTQALADVYTLWKTLDKPFDELKILISSPDFSKGCRTSHAFALCMANLGAKIYYTGTSGYMLPLSIQQRFHSINQQVEQHTNLNRKQNIELLSECDLVYLPITSLAIDDPKRDIFLSRLKDHYISLDDLQNIRKLTGKTIKAMHPLPRNPDQFDYAIDDTEHEIYFKTVKFSICLRMALISVLLINPK